MATRKADEGGSDSGTKTTGRRRSARPQASQRRARQQASRAYKHERDLQLVMKALHGVLTRAGKIEMPFHDGWNWNNAVPLNPDGSQNTCELRELEAIVTAAAMLTESAYGWLSSPIGELERRAAEAASAEEFVPWLRENHVMPCQMLTNMAMVEAAGLAYGARVRSTAPVEALNALGALLRVPADLELDRLKSALAKLAPRPVVAGFYKPGASGALGQFTMHLREDGLSYEEIATTLGELKPREEHASDDKYRLHRSSVVDAVKHRINGEKRKLRRDYGSAAVLGGDDGAENLPRHERWVVLVSAGAQTSSPVTVHI